MCNSSLCAAVGNAFIQIEYVSVSLETFELVRVYREVCISRSVVRMSSDPFLISIAITQVSDVDWGAADDRTV
jgi:hypothetical protein